VRRTAGALGLGLALCLGAAGFAATPLYVPGVALPLIAGVAAAWVTVAARGARVARHVGGATVEEEVPLPVTVSASRARVPLPGAEVRAWPGGPVLTVSRRDDGAATAAVSFPRRGRHLLGPASLLVGDPLGLCSRTILTAADEVLVLPRVETVRFVDVGGEPSALGRHVRGTPEAGATEVDSLQPHFPGAPASRIHWPTVARTATLMERRLVADGDHAPLVVVDPREPSSADALDWAVRAAASLCVHLARRGGCALLLPGDRRPVPIDPALYGFAESHARLAMLEPGAGAPPAACLTGANVVVWITAATGGVAELAAVRAPVRFLVSPHRQGRWPVQFTVAGCSGQRLERAEVSRRAVAG
jgi:uncharacterized protein (DUF58 family)